MVSVCSLYEVVNATTCLHVPVGYTANSQDLWHALDRDMKNETGAKMSQNKVVLHLSERLSEQRALTSSV